MVFVDTTTTGPPAFAPVPLVITLPGSITVVTLAFSFISLIVSSHIIRTNWFILLAEPSLLVPVSIPASVSRLIIDEVSEIAKSHGLFFN